ncbi:MAG: hypothetical protein ACJAZB_000622 [Psychrosphaera sp.]|jgi:hypothetical protein
MPLVAKTKNIDVIVIDYPSFMTTQKNDTELSLKLLTENELSLDIQWQPHFLPSGQAYGVLSSGQWCASLHQPSRYNDYIKYSLTDINVKLGLIRKKQINPFTWNDFYDFSGDAVALLRSNADAKLMKQFKLANITVHLVDTNDAVISMVNLGHVDFGIIDNISYQKSEKKPQLQFTTNPMLQTETVVFLNTKCKDLDFLITKIKSA